MRINDEQADALIAAMDDCCAKLMELGCDSVQINTTSQMEGDRWFRGSRGKGNLYARYGAVSDWLSNQNEISLANEIAVVIDGDDDA